MKKSSTRYSDGALRAVQPSHISPMIAHLKRLAGERLPEPAAAALMAAASLYRDIRGRATHEPEMAFLPWLCDREQHSIDIGAHFGAYSYVMAKFSKTVSCLEPNPIVARALSMKFGLLRSTHVCVLNVAASDTAKEIELIVPNGITGLATVENLYSDTACKRVRIRALTVDKIAPTEVGFIKIDVEGHEARVLEGAEATLARSRPNLLIEAEERHARNALRTIDAFLGRFGYRGFYFHDGAFHPVDRFDPVTMQSRVSLNAGGTAKLPRAVYINNFVFTARPHTLHRILAGVGVGAVADP